MPPALARGTPAYRLLSWAMLLAGLATFALLYGVQPLLPLFAAEHHISAGAASLAVSLATGPMALALIPAGILSDRIGRRPLMIASLLASALLTLACAAAPNWTVFLALRLLTGLALAGIPAIAMTYVAEEVDAASIGSAMGLYIAGSAVGGMSGRLVTAFVADWYGWRVALAAVGLLCLASALGFARIAPRSRRFVPRRDDPAAMAAAIGRLARDAALPWLYAEGFLLMGAFVTVYNYAGFRLLAPPFSLSQSVVGAIFLLYLIGSASSAWFGGLAGRVGRRKVFWAPIALLLLGAILTATQALALVILGIAIVTVGFFGGHSIASSWVGRRAPGDRALAAAFYLTFYYLGSSILGSAGGVAWSWAAWPGVAGFVAALALLALAGAVRLGSVPPLPLPEDRASAEVPAG